MTINQVSMANTMQTNSMKNSVYCKPNYMNELKSDTVSFTGKKKVASEGKPKKSGFIHKALIACVGAPYPGLGQAINGQWGKAALFAIGTPVAAFAAATVSLPLAIAVGFSAYALSFIDTYRNA